MSELVTLLPRSSKSPWMTAHSLTAAARRPIPAELVKSVWNPWTCPVDLLPYLAWSLGLELWDPSWPESKQRVVCSQVLQLKRQKTRPAGIKAYVALTGAEVVKIVRPPARGFLKGAMSQAERDAWLAALPQIRIYPFRTATITKHRGFFSGPAGKQYRTSDSYLRTTIGPENLGTRATYYQNGVEVPVKIENISLIGSGDFQRVYIGTSGSKRMYLGRSFYGHGYMQTSRGATKTLSVLLDPGAAAFPIEASLGPVSVAPTRIYQGRVAPTARSFFGRFGKGRFLKTSAAPLYIYDRISLNDPSTIGQIHKVRSYHGHGRFGIADYKAEITIKVPMQRSQLRNFKFHGVGYARKADMTPFYRAIEAVSVSKANRDDILISTTTVKPIEFGSGLAFGDDDFVNFGDSKQVV